MSQEKKIHFNSEGVVYVLTGKKKLSIFLEHVIESYDKTLQSLAYTFLTDKALLKINKLHLQHDFYTDIITFDLSSIKNQVSGDIYISLDRVRENAKTHGVSVKNELHRVIFHGLLHLLGRGDKSEEEKRRMRRMEDRLLKRYFG